MGDLIQRAKPTSRSCANTINDISYISKETNLRSDKKISCALGLIFILQSAANPH